MGYTHFDKVSGVNGVAVGAKGAETVIVNSAGAVVSGVKHVLAVTFGTASAAETQYTICPVAGTVTNAYATQVVAGNTAAYTVSAGSAGANIATATITSASIGVASAVALSTGGTTVTAGQVLKFVRGVQGTAGASTLAIIINQTA